MSKLKVLALLCTAFVISSSAQTKYVSPFKRISSFGNTEINVYSPNGKVSLWYIDEQYHYITESEHLDMADSLEGALVVSQEIMNVLTNRDSRYESVWYNLSNGWSVLHSYNSVTIFGARGSKVRVKKMHVKWWIKCLDYQIEQVTK